MLLAFLLFLFAASTLAAPGHPPCWRPRRRVDWTTLKKHEKEAYFTAENCLLSKPSRDHFQGAVTRYDDLIYPHQKQGDVPGGMDTWHYTGQFLAVIHRFYVSTHETLLREECSYTGPIPYWNELPDIGNYNASRVLRDFGGEGSPVLTGPFGNLTVNLGPGEDHIPHILFRKFNDTLSLLGGQENYDAVLGKSGFGEFQRTIQLTLHFAAHVAVGGDMLDFMTSPADPLFWLHHAYVDMLWWKWQGSNSSRIHDFDDIGYETQYEPVNGYTNTTQHTLLSVFGLIPDVTVGDVLETEGGYLCYIYDI